MPHDPSPIAEQTLDELEGVEYGPPAYGSSVVTNVHRLRRVPLNQYRLEDLRLMIGQQNGVDYLVPRALDHLEADPLAAGDHYPGDLLSAVARLPNRFWRAHTPLIPRVIGVIDVALARVQEADTVEALPEELRAARERIGALPGRPSP